MNKNSQSIQEVAQKISSAQTSPNPRMYPRVDVLMNTNPSRFYAFPIIGGFVKIIIVIPQLIVLIILSSAASFITVFLNSFAVLFTGKYMQVAYDLNVLFMKWFVKIHFFSAGITDQYPGFNSQMNGAFSISVQKPAAPNKLYAVPVLGYLIRAILMIPYGIYSSVIQNAMSFAALGNSFYVLFSGKYSETTFELVRDNLRIYLARHMYNNGLSDTYPSWSISMNHKRKKIFLIVLGSISYTVGTIVWFAIQIFSAYIENGGKID